MGRGSPKICLHKDPLPKGEGGPRCLSEVEGAVGEGGPRYLSEVEGAVGKEAIFIKPNFFLIC
jgi:hypothetical protein